MPQKNPLILLERARKLMDSGKFLKALKILKGITPPPAPKTGILPEGCGEVKLPRFLKAEVHITKGKALQYAGFFPKAMAQYGLARKHCLEDADKMEAALGMCVCRRSLGDFKEALRAIKDLLKFAREKKMPVDEIELEYAMILRMGGDFVKALGLLKKFGRKFKKEKDPTGLSFVNWAQGGIYRLEGKCAESINAFNKAFSFARKAGDETMANYALLGLGGVLRVAGRMEEAREKYMAAKKFFARTEDIFAGAYSECGLANVLRQTGDLDEALKGYGKAFKLYSILEDMPDLGFVEWGRGEIYKKKGEFKKAGEFFRKAEKFFSKGLEERGELLVMISKAHLYYLTGKTKQAEDLYDKAYKRAKSKDLHTYLETFT